MRLSGINVNALILIISTFGACFTAVHVTATEVPDAIHVEVAPECVSHFSNAAFPFLDRVGDVRFSPRPLAVSAEVKSIVQPELKGKLVSAALRDHATLLIAAEYQDIFSLNILTGKLVKLEPDLSKLDNKKFVPAGIAIGPKSGRVFLANYLANNILVGNVVENQIHFNRKLIGSELISPENVTTTPDESWLVSANFDGNSVTAFAAHEDGYVHKWATEIPLAHGVAILRNMVFVSSLALRKIFVLNLNDGKVIGAFGQPGWNTYCLDFLWPTDLKTAGDNLLLITDAHTGGVYRIAFEGMIGKVLDVIGGTTPGPMGLQMPYATTLVGDDIAILSTFSPKILVAGPARTNQTPAIKKLIVQQAFQAERRSDWDRPPLGVGWNGYVHMAADPITISGLLMVPSYGALRQVSEKRPNMLDHTFALTTWPLFDDFMYFIEAHELKRGVVLSSPSATFALYVTRGQTSCLTKINLPGAPLATEDGLQHRLGTSSYGDIEQGALARLRELDSRRGAGDLLELSEIAKSFGASTDVLTGMIKTKEANDALHKLARCRKGGCGNMLRDEIIDQYKEIGSSFLELLLLDMSVHRCIRN